MSLGLGGRLQMRIVAGLLAVLAAVTVWMAYHLNIHYNRRMSETVHGYASYLSQTVENAFEFAMSVHNMEGIKEGIDFLKDDTSVKRILLVNASHKVVMASPDRYVGQTVEIESSGCADCHDRPAASRSHATVVSVEGSQVLRVAVPVRNEPQCRGCHDDGRPVEGMVILDYGLERVKGLISPEFWRVTLFFAVATVALVVGIGLMMNRLVVRRIDRLTEFAHRIGGGHFGERVDFRGTDEIAQLGDAFNEMAGNLGRLTDRMEADRTFLDRLINSMEDKIVVYDPDLRVVTANRAAEEGAGAIGPGVACEWVCKLKDTACNANEGYCLVRETFETGVAQQRVSGFEQHGVQRHIECVTAPVWEGDTVARVLFVCRDITERRVMEAELIRAERLASLGRLAAGVAHEINTPMASITACAEGLQRRIESRDDPAPGITDLPECLETIRDAAYRAKEIAGKLLNLSRKTGVEIRDVAPNDLVEEVIALVRPEAESQGKSLKTDLGADLPAVACDRTRLGHAVSNLIRNGLDAIEGEGSVLVTTERTEGGIAIRVQDTGVGISEREIDRIFDPFYTTKPPGKGTGLGLSICERIVRDHDGSVSVRSSEGAGTVFTVSLPVSRPAGRVTSTEGAF